MRLPTQRIMASISSTLKGKYPAKAHAKRVAERIQKTHSISSGVIYLEGQKTRMIEDNDGEQPFRQRRYFYYLTGCNVPDCYFTYDISSQTSTLYIPPIDPSSVIWSGLPLSPEDALRNYEIDHVKYSTDVNPSLAGLPASSKSAVWTIKDQVSPHITFLEFDKKDFETVKKAIEECRVVKDDYEIALTKHANDVSKIAHTAVLKAVKHAENERELEGLFIEKCIANGCREQAYHSIVAGGVNGATLHYQKNDEDLKGRLNLLLDAGGEYNCYASDITRTFPINGKWSKESREIYDTVLKMQLECTEMLKEGVLWESVHEHAHKVAIEGLLKIGILKGTAEEIFKSRTSVAFFPHGLGHYLGMDTHDTGGNPNYDDKDSMFKYLRVRGTLPAGSIITVEPGIYFCRFIIVPYLENPEHVKYIDKDVLEKYWDVGGVRIEDNVLVTKSSYENLTTCTKDPVELEKIISSS